MTVPSDALATAARQAVALPVADAAGHPVNGQHLVSGGMSLNLPMRIEPGPGLTSSTPLDTPDPGHLASLVDFAHRNAELMSLTAGLTVALILGVALLIAWLRGRVAGWITAVSWIAAFGFSAEGMWFVAVDKAHVPGVVAVGVFFVFELFQIRSMLAARRRYDATTVRDEAGKVTKAGDPGGHGWAVWVIAGLMGLIVALAARNAADALLRVSIPMGVALLWWNDLTEDGVVRDRPRSSWRWTPRRLLLAVGAIEAGERDIEQVNRDRLVKQLVALEFKRRYGPEKARAKVTAKLHQTSLSADAEMIAEVRRRVDLSGWFREDERDTPTDGAADTTTGQEPDVGRDNPSDVSPDSGTDTAADSGTDTAPDNGADAGPDTTGTPQRTQRMTPERRKADRLRAAHPDITHAELARRVGVSDKTISRWYRAPKALQPAASNGHGPTPTTPKES